MTNKITQTTTSEKVAMDIINKGNSIGDTPLMIAVKNQKLSTINRLLQDVNVDIEIKNNMGYTPYTYALEFCDTEIISAFQSFYKNSNNYLLSSICDAVHNRDYPTITNLLLNKCDIDIIDNNGYTPFQYAVAMNDKVTIDLFINIVGFPCFEQKIRINKSFLSIPLLAGFYNHDDLREYLAVKRLALLNDKKN